MKKAIRGVVIGISITVLSIFALIGCSNKENTLYVYNWADYIDQSVIEDFESEYGCKVVIDTFDSNEQMLAKVLAGATGYDVAFPTSYIIPTMVRHGILEKIDIRMLPDVVANFDRSYNRFLLSTNFEYSVPYAFGYTGIAYRSDRINLPEEPSWNVFSDTNITRVCILDDMREIIGIALKVNGCSVNSVSSDEISKAAKVARKWKVNARKMDNEQYKVALVSGEINLAMGYNADIMQVKSENEDVPIKFVVGKEGSTCCFDEVVLMKGCKRELAHKFVNFLYRPNVALRNFRLNLTIMPNNKLRVMLPADELANEVYFPNESMLGKLELENSVDDAIEIYNKAWDEIKANKK